MSPEASNAVLSATGELQLTTDFNSTLHQLTTNSPTELHATDDDVAVDPAVMQAKIKELTNRIFEVLYIFISDGRRQKGN